MYKIVKPSQTHAFGGGGGGGDEVYKIVDRLNVGNQPIYCKF